MLAKKDGRQLNDMDWFCSSFSFLSIVLYT